MASLRSSLRSGVKRTLFGTAGALRKRDPSGRAEARFWRAVIARMRTSPAQLQSLAWQAEEQRETGLAFAAWRALSRIDDVPAHLPSGKSDRKLRGKGLRKLAQWEQAIRLSVLAQGRDGPGKRLTDLEAFAFPPPLDIETVSGECDALAAQLTEFWQAAKTFDPVQISRLCKAIASRAATENREGRPAHAAASLQPVLTLFPTYQTAYPQMYKAVLETLAAAYETAPGGRDDLETAWNRLEAWWAFFDTRAEQIGPSARDQMWQLSLRYGHRLQDTGDMQAGLRLIAPMAETREDNAGALALQARLSESRQDWESAARDWQLYAAIMNPVSTKSGTIKARNAKMRMRQANYGRAALRRVRTEQALAAHDAGQGRVFREKAVRILESLPDQRMLKFDPRILEVARRYVQDAMREDGTFAAPPAATDGVLRRVVIALDILKVSDVHTHSRVIFTMCRNLLAHDPALEIHVAITNERFAVTTPVVTEAFDPTRDAEVETRARAALGEVFGQRFFLHHYLAAGLEGVAETAAQILALAPDLVLYGGGHRGLYSNESRLVRHVLYDLLPAAFFYIQANNEVDPKFDMIIARGPHAIEGDPGQATVREQPYPTIVDDALSAAQQQIDPVKARTGTIVSAITGVRMDVRLSEMDAAEMAAAFSILDRVPGSVWHFIGCRNIAAIRQANPEIDRRVTAGQIVLHTVMPFEDFTELVTNASLFLHLPGFTGGSGGAAVARRAAIPILTFNHSDVSGRQPPETIFEEGDLAGFADLAVTLLSDEARWTGIAARQIAHTNWIRETSVEGFHDCLRIAAELGRARLAQERGGA